MAERLRNASERLEDGFLLGKLLSRGNLSILLCPLWVISSEKDCSADHFKVKIFILLIINNRKMSGKRCFGSWNFGVNNPNPIIAEGLALEYRSYFKRGLKRKPSFSLRDIKKVKEFLERVKAVSERKERIRVLKIRQPGIAVIKIESDEDRSLKYLDLSSLLYISPDDITLPASSIKCGWDWNAWINLPLSLGDTTEYRIEYGDVYNFSVRTVIDRVTINGKRCYLIETMENLLYPLKEPEIIVTPLGVIHTDDRMDIIRYQFYDITSGLLLYEVCMRKLIGEGFDDFSLNSRNTYSISYAELIRIKGLDLEMIDMKFLDTAIEEVKGFLKELSRRDEEDTKLP